LRRSGEAEDVAGGLGKRVDLIAMLKGMLTPDQFRRVELYARARLTDAEFDTMHDETIGSVIAAGDKIHDRALRRIIRARE
jgi:hypothetical protein